MLIWMFSLYSTVFCSRPHMCCTIKLTSPHPKQLGGSHLVIFSSGCDVTKPHVRTHQNTHLQCHPYIKAALTVAATWTPTLIQSALFHPRNSPLWFSPGLFIAAALTSQTRAGWRSSHWPSPPPLLFLSVCWQLQLGPPPPLSPGCPLERRLPNLPSH